MIRRLFAAAMLTVAPLNLHAQGAAPKGRTTESVLVAEVAGCSAYEHNDAEGIRRFLADDYTLTVPRA